MRRPTRRPTISALVIVASLALVGCGGSGGGGIYGASSSTPGAAAASGALSGASSASADGAAVEIKDFMFSPSPISVSAGQTVTWTNGDTTAHTVTLDDGSANSGPVNPGATFSQGFANTGTFTYHCSIHPQMKAVVQVTG
jgi:plastocyanin